VPLVCYFARSTVNTFDRDPCVDVLEALLAHPRLNLAAVTHRGESALHCALGGSIAFNPGEGTEGPNARAVRALIAAGVPVDTTFEDDEGVTHSATDAIISFLGQPGKDLEAWMQVLIAIAGSPLHGDCARRDTGRKLPGYVAHVLLPYSRRLATAVEARGGSGGGGDVPAKCASRFVGGAVSAWSATAWKRRSPAVIAWSVEEARA